MMKKKEKIIIKSTWSTTSKIDTQFKFWIHTIYIYILMHCVITEHNIIKLNENKVISNSTTLKQYNAYAYYGGYEQQILQT